MRKAKKAEKKLAKIKSKFNFVIDPYENSDRVIVLNGEVYRLQFKEHGFILRHEVTDEPIVDDILMLNIMEKLA